MNSRMCSCYNPRTCPRYQISAPDEEPSSQKSSAPEHSDKETQTTPNQFSNVFISELNSQSTREYEAISNYPRKHLNSAQTINIDMRSVYRTMEDPYLFRGCLMRIALITHGLVKLVAPVDSDKHRNDYKPFGKNLWNAPFRFKAPLGISRPEAYSHWKTLKLVKNTKRSNSLHDLPRKRSYYKRSQSAHAAFLQHETCLSKVCDCGREKLLISETGKFFATESQILTDSEIKCPCYLPADELQKTLPVSKRKVFPQHKDLGVCLKCYYDPSLLVDHKDQVLCPGNCGYCLCPWKSTGKNNSEDVLKHTKMNVCQCHVTGSPFPTSTEMEPGCNQTTYFDICPCREKAVEKCLELCGFEMGNMNNELQKIRRSSQGQLSDVKELESAQSGSSTLLPKRTNAQRKNMIFESIELETPLEFHVQNDTKTDLNLDEYEYTNLTKSDEFEPCRKRCYCVSHQQLKQPYAQEFVEQTSKPEADQFKSCVICCGICQCKEMQMPKSASRSDYPSDLPRKMSQCNVGFLQHVDHPRKICDCGREKLLVSEAGKCHANKRQTLCESEMKCTCDISEDELQEALKTSKRPTALYRKMFPQHKDLDVCIKCRFDPSPLVDNNGHVFCPGNCGCCLCPWRARASSSSEDAQKHNKLKMCKCRDRRTLFTNITEVGSACSQTSFFDICPCREMAESKYLEQYGFEMWDKNERLRNIHRGSQVLLADVKELVPAKPESING